MKMAIHSDPTITVLRTIGSAVDPLWDGAAK
jgi:hypothetical protein